MRIIVDDREEASGLIALLRRENISLVVRRLRCGDCLINGSTCVERKTARDFAVSIIDGRLFAQVSRMKKAVRNPLLLIEGDPFLSGIDISRNAVKGALISVTAIWNVPIVFSASLEETKEILLLIGRQWEKAGRIPLWKRGKHRKRKSKRLFFLQGLPRIGPERAERLLDHFGSVLKILNAGDDELLAVKGIGKSLVREIREILAE
ncbi:MAG: hypothetical protein JXD23_01000 [Spirochaetales bacterium]|nr:hypothetical protein [Spirochaetales bacterium]